MLTQPSKGKKEGITPIQIYTSTKRHLLFDGSITPITYAPHPQAERETEREGGECGREGGREEWREGKETGARKNISQRTRLL